MTALAGANVLFGQGMLEAGLSYDIGTLISDNEILDYVYRILAGFKVDAITTSVDLIKRLGADGIYLAEEDTVARLPEMSNYEIMNREGYSMWEASGKPTLREKARAKGLEILATHKQRNPLSQAQVKALRDYVIEAEEYRGVSGFWKGKEDKRFIDNLLY